jgi:WD40 repeat protein
VTLSDTNQRLEFDLDVAGRTLYMGGRDGCVRVYDVKTGKLQRTIDGLEDAANGVSFYEQCSGEKLLAVATGSRRFPSEDDFDLDALPTVPTANEPPGHLRIYRLLASP